LAEKEDEGGGRTAGEALLSFFFGGKKEGKRMESTSSESGGNFRAAEKLEVGPFGEFLLFFSLSERERGGKRGILGSNEDRERRKREKELNSHVFLCR